VETNSQKIRKKNQVSARNSPWVKKSTSRGEREGKGAEDRRSRAGENGNQPGGEKTEKKKKPYKGSIETDFEKAKTISRSVREEKKMVGGNYLSPDDSAHLAKKGVGKKKIQKREYRCTEAFVKKKPNTLGQGGARRGIRGTARSSTIFRKEGTDRSKKQKRGI